MVCFAESNTEAPQLFNWEQIASHNSKQSRWLVINGAVYDVTQWAKKHPGGERLIANHSGEDATDAFTAFHNDKGKVEKYLKTFYIGKVGEDRPEPEIVSDFRLLRYQVEKMKLFDRNSLFYLLHFGQILVLTFIAWVLLFYYFSWFNYAIAVLMLLTAQAQAGWLQHDFGHLSVFRSRWLNHLAHRITICTLKGVSSDWWNYRHFQHHAKPNVEAKDPDVRFSGLFLLGKVIPVEWGKAKKGFLPYQQQHTYFCLLVPPLLLPLYFNIENLYFLGKRKDWAELSWALSFFVWWTALFGTALGVGGALMLYVVVRFLESHWFVWTTQMSHLPMDIDHDRHRVWFTQQLAATCNVEASFFNDWFSGHLNYQIEHHLFPTMPRHNLYKVVPLVKSLCQKHGIKYECKPMLTAFADIYRSLRSSGELWLEAYHK